MMKPHTYPCILDAELIAAKAVRGVSGPTRTFVKMNQSLTKQKQQVTALRNLLDSAEEELIGADHVIYAKAEQVAYDISNHHFPDDGDRGPAFHACKGLIESRRVYSPPLGALPSVAKRSEPYGIAVPDTPQLAAGIFILLLQKI